MRVLMWSRVDMFEVNGGDLVQMKNTAEELEKLGVEVKLSGNPNEDLSEFDLIHVFQMDWAPEPYFYAKKAKAAGKPLILSPIHHSVKEVKRFDDIYSFGIRKIISFFFREQHHRDTWKNIYRSFKTPAKMKPTIASVFLGLKNMHKKTLGLSDKVLVQTEAEAKDLKDTYGVDIDWVKIPNGVGTHFSSTKEFENQLGITNYILCVGRIEARKNNLNIIKAVEEFIREDEVEAQLVFVGKKSSHHGEFIKKFEEKVAKNNWITYVPYTPWEEMPALFHNSKVLVSASWFETSGLTLLEGLFSGTNAVAAGSRAPEILGDLASYCDPADVSSIKEAIKKQYDAPRPTVPEDMKKEYTWENVAKKTLDVYKSLLRE